MADVQHYEKTFLLVYMASDVYNTVVKSMLCSRNHQNNNIQQKLRLFPPADPLDIVGIDILGPLHKTESGNKYIVVMTNCYS